ncbi:MAG TPA: DUF3175 domain-containing protein [Gemmatimonadaceae bacterium]|nr:DUF3175 domain-containing protein [Gemmatimonadaceae bacterium]
MNAGRKRPRRRRARPDAGRRRRVAKRVSARRWSAEVTAHSNALDLQARVFTWKDPRRIAASLKRSAELSRRRKGTPYQSAMSMLTFYINRAGTVLRPDQRRVLQQAKRELRAQFGRE